MTDWKAYLTGLDPSPANNELRRLWSEIRGRMGLVAAPPHVSRDEDDDSLHLHWEGGRQCASVDIWPDAEMEWFWMDRDSHKCEGTDGGTTTILPDTFFRLLRQTLEARCPPRH